MRRASLRLRRELLPELTAADLAGVAGGNTGTGLECLFPTYDCLTVETGLDCIS